MSQTNMCRSAYDGGMATLEKRVQVLLAAEQYARIEAAARDAGSSVGAFIREAVEERLAQKEAIHRRAWDRIFARADELPPRGPIDWDEEKAAFDQDILREEQDPIRRAS